MADTIKEERLRWVVPVVCNEISLTALAKVCPYGTRTLERWVAAYKKGGEKALEPRSTKPKSHPKETPISIKEKVIALRKSVRNLGVGSNR